MTSKSNIDGQMKRDVQNLALAIFLRRGTAGYPGHAGEAILLRPVGVTIARLSRSGR